MSGLLSRLMEADVGPRYGPADDFWYEPVNMISSAGMAVTPETALRISAFFACLRVIGETVLSAPLKVYRRLPNGDREEAPEHPLWPILHGGDPNDDQTSEEWRETHVVHTAMRGTSWSKILPGDRGPITHLQYLHPDRVKVDRLPSGRLRYQVLTDSGTWEPVSGDSLFRFPGLSSNGVTGLSVLDYARESLGISLALQRYAGRTFSQGVRPSGVLEHPGSLTDKEKIERLRRSWQEVYAGADNAGKTVILEDGMKYHQVGMTNDDAQMLDSEQWQVNDVARWFRMPLIMIQEQEKSTSWGCLPGDSMVFTIDGPKSIADVKVGVRVWSLGEAGIEAAAVIASRMTSIRKYLSIETAGRTIRATDNHWMMVRRHTGYAEGKRKGETGWQTLWLQAGEVRAGDYLPVPHGFGSGSVETAPHGRRLTDEAMEICGLFTGDGNTDKGRIEIAHEVGADHMDYYRAAIEREFGVKPYVDGRETRTRFSSPAARALIEDFTGTAHTKRVPGWVYGLTRELQVAFLRGYLDSDGSVQRGRIVYSSANRLLLEDVRHLCIQVGIPVGRVVLGRKAGRGIIRGRPFEAKAKFELSLSSVSYNVEIGSHSAHKAAKLDPTPTMRRLVYDEGWNGPLGRGKKSPADGWPFKDVKLQRVRKITESKVEVPVYDITVEGTQTFIADGVLVHNTGVEHQQIGFVVFTMLPWFIRHEKRINKQLIAPLNIGRGARPDEFYCEYTIEALLRGDIKTRYEAYQIAAGGNAPWMNRQEIRRKENLNRGPGELDEFLQPMNMGPAGLESSPRGTLPSGAVAMLPGPVDPRLQTYSRVLATQMVRLETEWLKKAARKHADDAAGWEHEVREFYGGLVEKLGDRCQMPPASAEDYSGRWQERLLNEGAQAAEGWETAKIEELQNAMLQADVQ